MSLVIKDLLHTSFAQCIIVQLTMKPVATQNDEPKNVEIKIFEKVLNILATAKQLRIQVCRSAEINPRVI